MTRYFCTLFDSGYLFKGVVMLRTLNENCAGAQVFVLRMDEPCRRILEQLGLPGVTCISLPEVESAELLAAKKDRNVGFTRGMKSTTCIKSRRRAHRFLLRRPKEFLKRIVKY